MRVAIEVGAGGDVEGLVKPDVIVKGGDYVAESVVGFAEVTAAGGRVEIVPTVEGFSTTNLVKKLSAVG